MRACSVCRRKGKRTGRWRERRRRRRRLSWFIYFAVERESSHVRPDNFGRLHQKLTASTNFLNFILSRVLTYNRALSREVSTTNCTWLFWCTMKSSQDMRGRRSSCDEITQELRNNLLDFSLLFESVIFILFLVRIFRLFHLHMHKYGRYPHNTQS